LLDTTRAYAFEKLEEHAEVNVVLRRHAEYVAGYLESERVPLFSWVQDTSGAA
jgi:predicted ATPase